MVFVLRSLAFVQIRDDLWQKLNRSNLGLYMHLADTRSETDPTVNRSPEKLTGYCNATCAAAYWKQWGNQEGPVCGVPGCEKRGDSRGI